MRVCVCVWGGGDICTCFVFCGWEQLRFFVVVAVVVVVVVLLLLLLCVYVCAFCCPS